MRAAREREVVSRSARVRVRAGMGYRDDESTHQKENRDQPDAAANALLRRSGDHLYRLDPATSAESAGTSDCGSGYPTDRRDQEDEQDEYANELESDTC